MPHRAHRTVTLLLAAGCLLLAGAAQAQTASGPRYMNWANRPATTTPGNVVAAQAQPQAEVQARTPVSNGMIPRRIAPSQALSRPMMQPTPQVVPVSRGLTPASAWLGPRVAPAYAPGSPDPTAYAFDAPTPAAEPAVYASPPAPRPAPAPVPAPAPALQPTVEAAPAPDPMAPRRDAPIFRLQQQQAAGAPTSQAAPQAYAQTAPQGQQGARYYSVHRDAGRQPDPTVMPEPVFFDSVTLDLAEPPANEPLTRDGQGRRRPLANDDPSLP